MKLLKFAYFQILLLLHINYTGLQQSHGIKSKLLQDSSKLRLDIYLGWLLDRSSNILISTARDAISIRQAGYYIDKDNLQAEFLAFSSASLASRITFCLASISRSLAAFLESRLWCMAP